jgi:hypothetical protein
MRALGRAPALSLRTRLTLVYGSLFLVTSALLVAVTYVLTVRTMDRGLTRSGDVDPEAFSRLQRLAAEGGLTSQDGIAQLMALREDADRRLAQQKRDVLEQLLQSSVLLMLVVGVLAVVFLWDFMDYFLVSLIMPETAIQVFRALGANELDVLGELAEGIPVGAIDLAGSRRIPVVTKAGGFGGLDALGRAADWIRSDSGPATSREADSNR